MRDFVSVCRRLEAVDVVEEEERKKTAHLVALNHRGGHASRSFEVLEVEKVLQVAFVHAQYSLVQLVVARQIINC